MQSKDAVYFSDDPCSVCLCDSVGNDREPVFGYA